MRMWIAGRSIAIAVLIALATRSVAQEHDGRRKFSETLNRLLAAASDKFAPIRGEAILFDAENEPSAWRSSISFPGSFDGAVYFMRPLGTYHSNHKLIESVDVDKLKKVYQDTVNQVRATLPKGTWNKKTTPPKKYSGAEAGTTHFTRAAGMTVPYVQVEYSTPYVGEDEEDSDGSLNGVRAGYVQITVFSPARHD